MRDFFTLEFGEQRNRALLLIISFFALVVLFSLFNNGKQGSPVSIGRSNYTGGFGADMITVDNVIAREFGLSVEGVFINRVYPQSPAGKAGLKRGDILIDINGTAITSVSRFTALLTTVDPHKPAKLLIIRQNQDMMITLPRLSDGEGGLLPTVSQGGTPQSSQHTFIASALFVSVFLLLFLNLTDRTVIITVGAVLMVIVGRYIGFYSQEDAIGSIRFPVICLILGLHIVTLVLERAGFFRYLSYRILLMIGQGVHNITLVFCSFTFLFSAFVNNLTTIMVFLPVSLSLIKNLPIDRKRFLFCIITASNLGGASTMIGDFPNMLISSEQGLLFHDVFFNLAPLMVILMGILFWYGMSDIETRFVPSNDIQRIIDDAKSKIDTAITNHAAVVRGLIALKLLIVGFILTEFTYISPSTMAIAAGFILLLFESHASELLKKVAFTDIIFFCSLFILVGGLGAAGVIEQIAYWLSRASNDHFFFKLVLIMLVSVVCTSFLNAGPATALLLPVLSSMTFQGTSTVVWWTLSIGVCIGSSAALTGATAGSISVTMVEKYLGKGSISFFEYSKTALPVVGVFTVVSIVYIGILSWLGA